MTRRGHKCPKHAAALGYGLDCTYDLRLAGTLQEVTAGAHAECGKHRIVVGEHGEHKDRDIWAAVGDAPVASMPPTPGMSRSMITTSGWSSRLSAIACRPSAASPTTSKAGADSAAPRPSR
jgi:hypothetical protein